jgi:hypothetical protein
VFAANDTSGTLLAFRGWALDDRRTLAFNRQPLPPLPEELAEYQAPYTHPLIDLDKGFARRPGYYLKLAWSLPVPLRIELFRYDNRADPEVSNPGLEWGWRTQFDDVGLVADLGGATELKMQALSGRTRMGMIEGGRHWIDMRFRSAFALVTRPFGPFGVAARIEAFDTRNRGSLLDSEYNEQGWAATFAVKRDWGRFTGVVELLHVSSRRDQLREVALAPSQRQTQLQADLRLHW